MAAVGTTAGPVAGAGFLLLGLMWIGCTLEALLRIRGGDVEGHRRWMVRSVALTLAAVTLRLYLGGATALGADVRRRLPGDRLAVLGAEPGRGAVVAGPPPAGGVSLSPLAAGR